MGRFVSLSGAIGLFCLIIWVAFRQPINTKIKKYQEHEPRTSRVLQEEFFLQKKQRKLTQKDRFKFDNPDAYDDFHRAIRTRDSEAAPGYPADYRVGQWNAALRNQRYRLKSNARTSELTWQERGPSNVPGRVRALLVLPDGNESKTWLAGAVGGGIWKTRNAGQTWVNKTADLPSLAISWMAHSPSAPDIIYAATGEANGAGRGLIGNGVFKSVDGGDTWAQLPSTANDRAFSYINRIIVDPNDPDNVLICTSQGEWEQEFRSEIYKSTDGGNSWNMVYDSNGWVFQIVANPMNFQTIYAGIWGLGVVKSIDGGATWFESSAGFKQVYGRVELATAPTDSSIVYASVQGDVESVGADLYASFDAGSTWSHVEQNYDSKAVDFLGGQGDYDNTIAVSPYDPMVVYYGGVSLWRTSINTGQETTNIQTASVYIALDDLSQWEFVNFDAAFYNGKLEIGDDITPDEFVDVEIRTGPGLVQKAHRFSTGKQGAGVPDEGYSYLDYVDVPMEVWDITNNRQLMISFRDQQEDSLFNLIEQTTEDGDEANHSREYLYIHDVTYASMPNSSIATNGGDNQGHTYRQLYFFWPVLRAGLTWDAGNMPIDTIRVDYENLTVEKRFGNMQPVSDAYGEFLQDFNPAYASEAATFVFHPDHHNLLMLPVDTGAQTFKILNANDGGVYFSNTAKSPGVNNGDWSFAGTGFNTGQFYSATKKPGSDQYIGGLQDNGTWLSPTGSPADEATAYTSVIAGDGFDVLWHAFEPEKIIGSSQNNNLFRSEDGGNTWTSSTTGLDGVMPFFSKLAYSRSHPDRIFTVSSLGVYRSENFGKNWILSPISLGWSFTSFLEVKVSDANPEIVWAGSGMSSSRTIQVSTDGGKTFTPTTQFTQAELGIMSGMATHPYLDSTAYVLFSFAGGPKVLRTNDLGNTWEDISGFGSAQTSSNGFPDVAVYSLLVRPDDTDVLWAGTEIGLFESTDNGDSWTYLNNGPGAVGIWEMQVVDDQIVIATHGRGIFTATMATTPEITLVPKISGTGTSVKGDLNLGVELRSSYDSVTVLVGGTEAGIRKNTDIGTALFTVTGINPGSDSLDIEVISYKSGKPFHATPVRALLFDVGSFTTSYTDNFNGLRAGDFIGSGFSVTEYAGFDDGAIHSRHPYKQGSEFSGGKVDFVYQLRMPVIISNRNPYVEYRDIAIVEPGEPNVLFPAEDFYDYVVVEGSRDGFTWQAIGRGYDAGKNGKWINAYNVGQDGDKSMFVNQKINLLSTFEEQDTIFIRFRLYSDPLTNAWGWAIDDLSIQAVITALDDAREIDEKLKVYPNPATDFAIASFKLEKASKVRLVIMDVQGRIRRDMSLGTLSSGTHQYALDNIQMDHGLYVLRLETESGYETFKWIVN